MDLLQYQIKRQRRALLDLGRLRKPPITRYAQPKLLSQALFSLASNARLKMKMELAKCPRRYLEQIMAHQETRVS